MPTYILTDGSSPVYLTPEFDYKADNRKIENQHRTRGGRNYRYVWSVYKHLKFKVQFVSSADMTAINSWWGANTPLRLYDINSAVVASAYLVNASAPIDQFVQPYTDQYQGTIELESY